MSGKYSKGGKKLGDAISLAQKTSDGATEEKTQPESKGSISASESKLKSTKKFDKTNLVLDDAVPGSSNENGSPGTSSGKKSRKRKKEDEVKEFSSE